jgi:hypothetical protein
MPAQDETMPSQLARAHGLNPTILRPRTPTPLSAAARRRRSRDILIAIAIKAGCSQMMIAEAFGMHQTAISKMSDRILRILDETE